MKRLRLRLRWFISLPLLLALACHTGRTERVALLYWGDFHAQNYPFREAGSSKAPDGGVGGAARFAYMLDSLRAVEGPAICLHSGDEFSGSAECAITRGGSQIRILNQLRPDALQLGNHEFDYGVARLLELLPDLRFPVVCSNLWDSGRGQPFGAPRVRPYVIVRAGRVRVAVIGAILLEFRRTYGTEGRLEALDPIPVVRKWATAVSDSADLVVLLSHMGYTEDVRLARELGAGYLDVILGGHSHRVLQPPETVNGVLIAHAGDRGRFIGKLVLEVDIPGGRVRRYQSELVPVRGPGRENLEVAAYLDSLRRALDARYHLDEIVAHLRGNWIREGRGESNVGDWQADAFRMVAKTDVAFQNSYGIRKDLPEGPVRVRDFWEMNPFSNELVVFEVTGRELLQILEHNCRMEGEMLQVSGVRYEADLARPEGRRLVRAVFTDGRPIRPAGRYTVCTNDYVAKNFWQYLGIDPAGRPIRRLGILDREAFLRVARAQRWIEARKDGRIALRRAASVPSLGD